MLPEKLKSKLCVSLTKKNTFNIHHGTDFSVKLKTLFVDLTVAVMFKHNFGKITISRVVIVHI